MRGVIRGGWVVGFAHGAHTLVREGVVVWEGDRGIWGARVTADGTRLDRRLWMSSQPGTPGNGAGDYTYPVVGAAYSTYRAVRVMG